MTAPNGPPVMHHSGKSVNKATGSKANAKKIHDKRQDDPDRLKHLPGENPCFVVSFWLIQFNAKFLISAMSLSQQPVSPQKSDKLTFEHLVHSIKLLNQEVDIDKFNKIASDLQAVICNGLKSLDNTVGLLSDITAGLNNVRVGSHTNKAIGQGSMTCCSYISLMFIHLIRCKNVKDYMNIGDYKDFCGKLGSQEQGLINLGKSCHITIMNILTHGDPNKDSNFPELGELNTLLNEVMPKQLINSPSAIDPASGIISSDVEDVSTYLHQCHHDNDTSVIQSFQMHPSQNHSYPSS